MSPISSDNLLQSSIVLPAVEDNDKMIHLLLTDKFFATAVMAAIHSGLLYYKLNPDQVNLNYN